MLVVEDDPAVRHFLDRLLAPEGDHLLIASTADDAAALLLDFPVTPDVALLDVVLPGLTGGEYAAVLRQRYPQIALVFITGFVGHDIPELAHPLIADARVAGRFLEKPFRPEALLDLVRRVRDRRTSPGSTSSPSQA
jgi:CheY-like chemotaxis protein